MYQCVIYCTIYLLNVCEDYAKEYNILFNASKSKLMHFGWIILMHSMFYIIITSNGSKIDYVEQCVHLGTTLYSDISIRNINNAVNDLFIRTNNLMVDFSNAHSSTYCLYWITLTAWMFMALSYGVLTIINL